ncbi:hypothetical protein SAMN04488029_3408 [Reichenbachiella faecimaris]|uniref:NIPSNAP protein n=1 Tax=Reichenbachiella faecimaris TaxID=692418 RepID=A0A1W2GMW0_REIFA|nr:hypothetical protein [Reichenbachiella faecimaris]SMD37678.1 hypothetical protein SAMN04488029_3408 [Reichenbachiella faecimaris]
MNRLIIGLLVFFIINFDSEAQNGKTVFAFYEYKVEGYQLTNFINGYKRDLEWHAEKNDSWDWVGWFVMTGDRRGNFIDATPNHLWKDFDEWNINGAENLKHNIIHWLPYVSDPNGSFRVLLSKLSNIGPDWYKSKLLKVIYFDVYSDRVVQFSELLNEITPIMEKQQPNATFAWMRTSTGGPGNYVLFLCANSYEELGVIETNFSESLPKLKEQSINTYKLCVKSTFEELWSYNAYLSQYGENGK